MMPAPEHEFLRWSLREPVAPDLLREKAAVVGNWAEVVELARRHEILPLLHRAVAGLAGAVPAAIRERVRDQFAAVALRTVQLDRERQRLTAALVAGGIPVIPWKGPVLGDELYGDITLRSCADLDLLVPPEQAWAAVQRLLADGYDPGFAVPLPRWPALQRAVNHLTFRHRQHDLLVELHWRPFHPMFHFPFDPGGHWQVMASGGGAGEGRLTPAETLVLLCAHGCVHRWEKLKWIVDVDRLVRRYPHLDEGEVDRLAGRMGARRCLYIGLALARDLCGLDVPAALACRLQGDRLAARLAAEVRDGLFAAPAAAARHAALREYRFHWQSRERIGDRLRWALLQLFAPRQADWELFPPGSRCYPLFYLERPLRMIWKWLVRTPLVGSPRRNRGGPPIRQK